MPRSRSPHGAGPSQRQLRVAELIRRRLAEALARGETHDPELGAMTITVGEVRTSPDLRHATAFVLPLGGEGREAMLEALGRNRATLRRLVSRDLSLKYAPDLRFAIDESFDRMDETRKLLASDAVQRDLARPEDDDDFPSDDGR